MEITGMRCQTKRMFYLSLFPESSFTVLINLVVYPISVQILKKGRHYPQFDFQLARRSWTSCMRVFMCFFIFPPTFRGSQSTIEFALSHELFITHLNNVCTASMERCSMCGGTTQCVDFTHRGSQVGYTIEFNFNQETWLRRRHGRVSFAASNWLLASIMFR